MTDNIKAALNRHQDLIWRIVIAAAVAVTFGGSLTFPAWLPPEWGFAVSRQLFEPTAANFLCWFHTPVEEYLSPVAAWSIMLDRWVWCHGGPRSNDWFAFGIHLQNLLWHLVSALLVYRLGRELCCRIAPAEGGEGGGTLRRLAPWSVAFAALFWAIHPQRAEAVVCLAGRRELMTVTFGVAALILLLRAVRRGGGNVALMIAALPLVVAAGVSPWLVTFPLVAFFVLRAVETEKVTRLAWFLRLAPSIAAALATVIAQFSFFRWMAEQTGNWLYALPATLRGAIVFRNIGNFFCRGTLPRDIVPFYSFYDPRSDSSFPVWIVLIAVFLLGRYLRKHPEWSRPLWSMVAAIFFALLPVLGWFRPAPEAEFADRFTAWPAVFLWLLLAVVLEYLVQRGRERRRPIHHLILSLLMAAVVLMGAFAANYKHCWRSWDGAAFVSCDAILRGAEERQGRGGNPDGTAAAAPEVPSPGRSTADGATGEGDGRKPASKKPHANPHALIRVAVVCWFKGERDLAMRIARDHLNPEEYFGGREQRASRSFARALLGMELVREGNFGEGGQWLLAVLDRPDWSHIREYGIDFADAILRHAIVSQERTGNSAKVAELRGKRERLKAISQGNARAEEEEE